MGIKHVSAILGYKRHSSISRACGYDGTLFLAPGFTLLGSTPNVSLNGAESKRDYANKTDGVRSAGILSFNAMQIPSLGRPNNNQ